MLVFFTKRYEITSDPFQPVVIHSVSTDAVLPLNCPSASEICYDDEKINVHFIVVL